MRVRPLRVQLNSVRNVTQFAGARLISVDDAGAHGQYGIRGNGCVDDAVNGYLLDGAAPSTRSICGATPLFLEDTVFPQAGPVDGPTPPSAVRAVLNHDVQRRLEQLVK